MDKKTLFFEDLKDALKWLLVGAAGLLKPRRKNNSAPTKTLLACLQISFKRALYTSSITKTRVMMMHEPRISAILGNLPKVPCMPIT